MNLQAAAYQILEQYIAGILYVNIVDTREWEATGSADDVRIPIYDVYYALFEIMCWMKSSEIHDASENEQAVYNAFLVKASIFSVQSEASSSATSLRFIPSSQRVSDVRDLYCG